MATFGALAAGFFARFTHKVLDYFLSRELPEYVGPGKRFPAVADLEAFDRDLGMHCRETARVVERFSGQWHDVEGRRQGGQIDPGRAADFAHGAFAKLTQAMTPGAADAGRRVRRVRRPAGIVPPDFVQPRPVALALGGPAANVRLQVRAVRPLFPDDPAPHLLDLLEVAADMYAADQSAPQANNADDLGDGWRRRFCVRVPVRVPDLWNAPAVAGALAAALGFLTDNEYRFEFAPYPGPGPLPPALDFGGEPFAGEIDEVALYSGGLDSLAGALDASLNRGRRALRVRHRSTEKWTPPIVDALATLRRLGGLAPATLTVDANKHADLTRDDT